MKNSYIGFLLFTVLFFYGNHSLGQDTLYWVGGPGSWGEPFHWSTTSGGSTGSIIPGQTTSVVFDGNSFTGNALFKFDQGTAPFITTCECNDMIWRNIPFQITLAGSKPIFIFGMLQYLPNMDFNFTGQTTFAAVNKTVTIKTAGKSIPAGAIFDGNNGHFNLLDDFYVLGNFDINSGHVITNNHNVKCYRFNSAPVNPLNIRSIDLGSSLLTIRSMNNLTNISSRITHVNSSMKVYSSGASKILFTGDITEPGNLCTFDAADSLKFDNIEFMTNGELIAQHDTFNDALFRANGTLHVDTCIFDSVEIYQLGLAYSNKCIYNRFLFSTHPYCGCGDCRNIDYGWLQGNDNQINYMVHFNHNGTIKGNNNYADSCRFEANGNLLSGSNEFNKVMMRRIWSYGCSCPAYSKDTLTIEKNKIQTIHDTIILFGEYHCEHTRITSNDNLLQGTIATNRPQFIDYIEIKGVNGNILIPPAAPDTAKRSIDLGNNSNWYFKNNYIPLEDSLTEVINVSPCSFNTNGVVTIWGKGGEMPYTFYRYTGSGNCSGGYSANNPPTNNVFTGLGKGTYQFKIMDAYGCESVSVNETVGGPTPVIINSVTVTPIPCYKDPPNINGTILIHATGGTGAHEYYLEPRPWQTDSVFNDVALGERHIQVRDALGCLSSHDTIMMTQRAELFLIIAPVDLVKCWGDSTGKIKIRVWGGTPPYNVLIEPVAPIVHPQNPINDIILAPNPSIWKEYLLYAGNYHIKITDGNGCIMEDYRNVFENARMEFTYVKTTVTVGSSTTYCLDVTPTGGIPQYTHHWNNGATTSMACGLIPGTWCDTITDSQGCRDTACILIEPLAIQPIPPDTVCFGMTNGSTCVTAYGGSTPYGYHWSNNTTQSCLINVNPGTYSVTVTDASGGVVLGSAIIYENPQITATFTRDTVSCGGGSDGSITITPSGGTPYLNPPEYSFLWSNGSTTNVASGLTAGLYSVTVTDSIGCPQAFSVVLPEPPPINIGFKTYSNCVTYSAEALVSGGNSPYAYFWSGGQTTNPASGLSPGTYTVTVTDVKSCSKTASVNVSALAVTTISTNVACFGACDGTATATASGGNLPYIITWRNSSNIIVIPSETTPVSGKIINLCPGDYTVTVVDSNNCQISKIVTISQPANPLAITTLTYTAMLDCFGDCDGVAAVFASGGTAPYTYLWENSATPGYIIGTAQNISGLCAGTYCVTVTDVRGCFVNSCFSILQPSQILFSFTKTDINCFTNGDVGQITIQNVTGGTPPYVYTIQCPSGTYLASPVFTGLPPGNYNLGVMDSKGCKSSCTPVPIIRPDSISIIFNPVNNPTGSGLNNGSITSSASGGVPPFIHYWFDSDGILIQQDAATTSTIQNLFAGAYCDSVVDANNCFNKKCTTLYQPAALIIIVDSSNISCFGERDGWIELTISGGVPPYSVLYNGQTTILSSPPFIFRIQDLPAGNYTFVVTDNNMNNAVKTVIIIEPDPVIINFEAHDVCFGSTDGWIKATPLQGTPPYTYLWSNGETTNQINNLTPNLWYYLTVTDLRACRARDSVFLPENPQLFVHINNVDSTVCKGNSIQMNVDGFGGIYPYTYSWLPTAGVVNPDQLEPLITPVFSETYVITMTDTKGCAAKDSITIGIDSIPHAAFTFQNICQSLEVHFTSQSTGNGSGIYEYLWDFGDGYQSSEINPVHTYIMVGSYNVSLTVKNYSECTDYTMDTVYVNPVIQVDFSADTVCLGAETRFTGYSLNPGTVVDYGKWYFDDLNPITVQPWVPVMLHQFTYSGMHSVRLDLFDNTGCSEGITKPVLVKSAPQVDFTYNWGCTSDTVKFTGQSSGAGGPAFWYWDFGDPPSGAANHAYIQNPSHVYNSPGLYHVTLKVTGANTCDNSATKSFYYDKSPNAAFNWSSPCFGSETHFTDQSYASTGLLIMWQWNFGDPNTGPMNTSSLQNPSHTFSAPGTYQVKLKVYDNGLCYDSLIREVVIFASPTAGFNVTEGCVGEFTEFHDISVDPGSLINHWHWDFGDGNTMSYGSFTDPVIHPYAVSGQYVVVLTVTDTNGCSNLYTKFVNVHPLPTVMFQFNPACANQTTYFTDFSSGSGSPVISWYWDFGDFTPTSTVQNPTHTYTTPGLYPVTLCVTNAANCSSCNTQTISVSPSPVADFTAEAVCKDSPTHFNNLSYCMGDNIVSWQWDFGDGSPTSNVQWPVHTFTSAGTFSVSLIVTSLHGCISTVVKPVIVHDRPVANFSWNQTGGQNCFTPGVSTQFTDLSTIVGGNLLSSWLWDFGDGNYGNTQNPVHQYSSTGVYYVTLTVFDINGCQNSIIKQVILAEKPIASFSHTITNCDEVCFTDASVGSGASIQSWFWDFGDPASGVQNFSTQQNPCHIYYTPVTQTYSIRLIVTNANGCSDTLDLPVTVSKPVPDFATVNQPCQGVATEFQDLSVSAGNFISAWIWDFGDPGSASNTSTDQNPIHIYTSVGTKYVTLTVTNGNGCTSNIGKPIEVSYPPQANWDFDRPNCFPNPTEFRDISMAQGSISIVSWDWNFGDGTPHSTLKDPVHSYLLEGTYPVTLTVVNANGCENYITKPFFNFRGPAAAFISDPVSKCIKEIVTFTDQSSPAFGNIVSWNWDFGDLSSHSTIQNPGHVYAAAGIFTVKLIVIDERGCADSVSQTITVNDLPATDFIADTACLGSETHFTNQTSGSNLSWLWNFGEPTSGVFNTSTLENPVHQYSSPGDYFVQLTVTNSNSCRKDTVKKITVVPLPMVNFSNSSPCSGEAVHFTDESTIYQGTVSEWKWNFGDGTGDFLGQNPTHTFINPGPYNVTLTITTTGNCPPTSATKQILIKSAPIADFAVSSLCVGQVQFNDMTNQNGGTSLISWDWNFGDPLSGPSNLSQLQNPIHIYTTPGSYLVSLIVANTDGCRDTLTSQVTVLPLPAVDFTAGLSCVSDTTCFVVNTVVTNIGAITAFAWDLNGDGSIESYDQNPCHVYPTSGTVNVTLTVTDTSGCKNSITHAINVKPPPIADFNTAGANCSNDSIRFINHSTCSSGYITQWIWNFGDGTSDVTVNFPANPNVAHLYNGLGPYTVKLTVESSLGCRNVKTQIITPAPSPLAIFNHSEPCLSQAVQFTDLSSPNGGGIISYWEWNFGDPASLANNTSLLQNPAHIFSALGNYQVKLTVTNSNGCKKDTTIGVTIKPLPGGDFSWQTSCVNQPVQFTVNPAVTNIPVLTAHHWDFGDGQTSDDLNPVHLYLNTGNFTVILTITDTSGCSSHISHVLNIEPQPTAFFSNPGTTCSNDSVAFTNLSTTTFGYIQKWEWDFGDGSPHEIVLFPNNPNVKKRYLLEGTYLVSLTVTNSHGCYHTYSHDVTVIPTPVANFHYADTCAKTLVHFTDASFPNGAGNNVSWTWDFGDPTSGIDNSSALQNPTHIFTAGNATYEVRLIVVNFNNCSDTIIKSVFIRPAPPVDFTFDPTCLNKLVDFTANLTIMLPATISSWDWDFGDGSAHSTNPGSASHLYLAAGVYQAVLTVVDTTGCSNSLTKTVYIVPAPIPAFTFTSATCDSMPVQFTDQSLIPAGFPGHITSWTWRWGDGSVTTISSPESPNVSHVFPGGVYHFNVWLTVTSSYGCIDSIGKPVTLIPKPTSAFEVSPGTPTCAAQSVQFNDLSAQNGGGIISLWSWNFGDAGSGVNNVSALQNPLHTFTGSGVYLVTLITRNLNNCADTVIKSITINQPPFANFSADTACAGNHMTFTDLSAANSGGGIISHLWNFGDGNTSTLVNPTNIYSAHGVYNVTLTVVNSNGCQHDTVKQVIVSPKPIPGFTSTSPACDSTFVHFTDQSVLPSGTLGFINKWIWTWGDGTSRTIISPESPNVSHLFPAGQYSFTVKLRVVTNSGCTDSISQPIQLIPRPVVSFEALPGSPACANQPVQFNDLSQTNGGGNIAGWLWNFGDPGSGSNNLSNLQNPTHNFATAATYNVALTVTNANGCSRSATLPVIVAVKPVANFIADTACAGGATQFTDASVSPGSLISSYAWNFGDGGSSNLQSPLHTFAAYGIYNVTLTVVNSNGCIHSVTKQVMVHPRPVPSFTVSQACCIGSPVTFTDHSFLPSGFSGYIKKWIWNFGDGTLPEVVTYPDPPNVTHTFAGASTSHNVRLTVISTSNCADSLEITVNSIPSPVANFSKPGATCLNQPVQFNDLSQTNGGGSIQTWSWNFGDPGSGANNFSTLQNPTHIFSTTMPYTVTLVVTSANGCSNTHDTVVTIHPLPVANFTNTSACQSYPVTFSDASTPAPAILSHSWNFGDGGVSTLASPQHIFTSYGNFLVTLTVTDTNGCIHSKSKTVTVNPKPVVDFSVAEVRCVGTPVSFTDNSFVPVGYSGTISGWLWNFDDGNTSTNPNPVHTFTGVGPSYNVKLRVTLTTGCIDSIVKPVNLIPSPIANFSHSSALCKNQPIQFTDLSLTNGGSALQNWSWNFGDPGSGTNNTSNLQNPTHIFASAGSYSVILMVENVNGCQKYDTVPVTINILPIAGFDASGSCQGNPFTFTNTSTANAASYTSSWNFGDGGTSVAQSPQHTYSAYGNYSVTLTIVNSNGCTHSVTTPVVVYPKPVAGFTFSPTSCAGSPVSFTDQSYMPTGFTGSISSWAWDFGDATTSTLPNPTHTYTGAATAYLVRLTVTSTHGCTGFIEKPVALIPAPVANFTHTGPLCANQPVQFTDLSQINGGTAIQSWSWNFDDPLSGANNTSTNQNPTHSFSGASDYHVILIVTNVNGCKDTLLPYPQISTTARPLAKFKADTACQGGYTHFTDSSTTISGTIVSHFWEFGDGTNSTAVNPSHLYATTGVFNVKLTVANSLGCQKDTIIPVTVLGKPIASFTYASPNCAGDSVQFNDFSTTPHGYIKKWVWNFGDGTPVVPIIFPQPQNIKHAFANGGTYNVTLTITTTDNCETQKVNTVQIGFRPYANFSFSANACPAQPVQFTDLSQLNGGPVLTNWNWNFGDPTTGVSNTSTAQNPTHIFSGSGAFIVHLIVTNSNGCVDSVLNGKTVTVNVAPVATFSADASCLGSPTQFTDASTPAGSIASWNWNFGDPGSGVNNASTLKDPVHIYNQLGTYTVTLQVINSSQCTHQTTMPVTVSPKPTSMFQYAVSCVDTNTQFTDLSIAPGSSIKTWKWDFGDGTPFVTIQNPIHVFTTAITHQVKLVVTNWAGCADSITLSVLTRPKPDAAFTYTSKFCKAGEVFFYDGSQGVGGAAINTRAWYFDTGGSVIFGIDPIHTFSPTNASYPVTLIVTDTYGCTDEIHDSLIFVKPGWGFTFTNNDTCQGYNTKFKPVNLAAGDSLRPVSWNFGDPNSFPNNTSSLYSPVHIFSGPGNFIVKMKAQNSDGCIDSIYREVHVDAAPNPQFNFVTATCDSVVYFTDSTLNPSTASITSWKWKWGDGTAPVIITPPLSGNTSHIYSAPGIYPATLIVTNINGCVDSITRSVQRFPCIKAGFTYADTLCARYKIAFADSSLPVTRINQWKWSWGDGTPSTVFTTHSSPVYHTFANPGTYLVTLQVRASVNGVVIFDNRSDSIKIQPTPKTLFSNLPVCLNQITLFRDTSNTYGESISKRRWNFTTNPADTSGLSNPPYQYDTVGIYNVKLFVTNRFGCKDSLVKPTRVYGLPVANYETSAACSGETAIFTDKSVKADTTLGFWRWFFGDPASSKDSSNLKNPGHRYTATGDYSIRMIAKDHFGCIDTIDSTLTVRETPVAAFTITENINGMPGKILLNNESSSKSYYLWDFGNGKISDLEENPIVQYENDGIFTIRLVVKDSSDCADTTSMKYEFIFGNLYVPNAFSPTSLVSTATGIEIRTFFPKGLNLMAYHAMVFDKWGHLVWESAKLDCDESPSNCKGSPVESWDGTFNGQPMPQDVYMWKISATFKNGKVWEGSESGTGSVSTMGTVTLIR